MKEEKRNHLRRIRIGAGLKQQDVAHLLGLKSHETISRMEHHKWIPSIGILIAYSVIFNARLADLIPYTVARQAQTIVKRTSLLHTKLRGKSNSQQQQARLRVLEEIMERHNSPIKTNE